MKNKVTILKNRMYKTRAYCNNIALEKSFLYLLLSLFPQLQLRDISFGDVQKITQCSEIIMTHDLSSLWNNLPVIVAAALSLEKN